MLRNEFSMRLRFFLGLILLVGVGCSRGPETFVVNGKVTLDGKPLHDGSVIFSPTDGSNDVATGKVIEGIYELRCLPGEKRVQIGGFTAENKVIPWTYLTENSGLTASVQESGPIDFDLVTKPSRRR